MLECNRIIISIFNMEIISIIVIFKINRFKPEVVNTDNTFEMDIEDQFSKKSI